MVHTLLCMASSQEEAEAMLADKKVVASAVNIRGNEEKIKARVRCCKPYRALHAALM